MIATRQRQVRYAWVLPALVGVILALTLVPTGAERTSPPGCLLCGEKGLSDAIRNVILFAPLGIVLAARGMKLFTALLLGAAFSIGVEGAQINLSPMFHWAFTGCRGGVYPLPFRLANP